MALLEADEALPLGEKCCVLLVGEEAARLLSSSPSSPPSPTSPTSLSRPLVECIEGGLGLSLLSLPFYVQVG
jgi:hypothetical protein